MCCRMYIYLIASRIPPGHIVGMLAAGMQGCRDAGISGDAMAKRWRCWVQGCRDAGMQGCRDAGMQGCRDEGCDGDAKATRRRHEIGQNRSKNRSQIDPRAHFRRKHDPDGSGGSPGQLRGTRGVALGPSLGVLGGAWVAKTEPKWSQNRSPSDHKSIEKRIENRMPVFIKFCTDFGPFRHPK